jgi:hypothetical protein
MNLVDELLSITRVLEGDGIAYAVCGGVAVTIHGATRTTKDIDLVVHRNDLARVLDLLRPLGYLFAAGRPGTRRSGGWSCGTSAARDPAPRPPRTPLPTRRHGNAW